MIMVLSMAMLFFLISCITVQPVREGQVFTPDYGYVVVGFTKKIDLISFGSREVFIKLHQQDTGRRFYLPFGDSGELRVLKVIPGSYKLEDFLYLLGIETIKDKDPTEKVPLLLTQPPRRGGAMLVSAEYPEEYRTEFTVNAAEIVYVGGYSWESRFSFSESGVIIKRSFDKDGTVYFTLNKDHAGIPKSMTFKSLAHE
jgi:hypothetical protein